MEDQRRNPVTGPRTAFAELAREAIRRAVPETRDPAAQWHLGTNMAWVRFPEDGRWTFIGLHRHLDWLSGDAGSAGEPCGMDELFPLPGVPDRKVPGRRVRLGDLLGGEDRWWKAGANEVELAARLEWMAIQLRVKGRSYFLHHPDPAR
jgi:hypothetical protein